jgi:hypothetical protein
MALLLHFLLFLGEEGMEGLPDEILLRVLGYLDPRRSFPVAALVCRRWRELLGDGELWRGLFEQSIGGKPHEHISSSGNIYYDNFKWIYTHLFTLPVPERVRFAALFGHSRLFRSLLQGESINPIALASEEYQFFSQRRNVVQAATEQGFEDIVFAVLANCEGEQVPPSVFASYCCTPDDWGYTAIHIAAMRGRYRILRKILELPLPEGSVDQPTSDGIQLPRA